MNRLNTNSVNSFHLLALTFVLAGLVSGCSGSSESVASESAASESVAGESVASDTQSSIELALEDSAQADSTNEVLPIDNMADAIPDSVVPDVMTELPVSEDSSQVIPDPLLPLAVRIDFDITVPAYSSEELQVRVVWGEIQEAAIWVGDEFWTLAVDLPLDTEHELAVIFYDKNGDVTLASYESTFKTGLNSAESYQISAGQFDSNRWDSDGDGVSNLDESILGGDSVQLELRESYFEFLSNFGASTYENQVPDERPYYEFLDFVPNTEGRPESLSPRWGRTRTLTIDIDEGGTGTYNDFDENYAGGNDITTWRYAATRTNTGDSVIWNAEHSRYHSDGVTNTYTISVEAKRVSAQTRSAVGAYSSRWNGNSPTSRSVYEYALTGKPIADSTACEPTAGRVKQQTTSWSDQERVWIKAFTTISKGVDDQFWTVVERAVAIESDYFPSTDDEGENELAAEVVDTYLTRNLGVTFYCDYPELR